MSHGNCLTEDFFSKIIPADISTFIGCMIISILFCLYHIYQKTCKIKCIRRCTNLVIYNCKFIVCLTDIQHRLDKVLTVLAKYPCNTYDKVFVQITGYSKLSIQLCLSIYIQWSIILAIWLPWLCALSIKHIIRTDIYHLTIQFFTHLCDIFGTACINRMYDRLFIFILCIIYCCPCCTMHHNIWIHFAHYLFYRCSICNIHRNIWHCGYRSSVLNTAVFFLDV